MRRSPEQPPDLPPCSPTQRQQAFLDRHNLNQNRPIDFYEASHTIGQFDSNRRRLSANPRQEQFLKERGKWREGMSRGETFDLIRHIMASLDRPA
jgi:hypothetical protein